MERLTFRDNTGNARILGVSYGDGHGLFAGDKDVLDRLADYEDAEEHGLLVRLPCKVGTKTFTVDEEFQIMSDPIERYYIDFGGVYFETENYYGRKITEIGKTVFLTREEVEAALEKDTKEC